MSWIRKDRIGSVLALALVTTLISAFFLNGVIHAVVPHSHTHGSEAVTQNMHAALRSAEKLLLVFAVVVTALFLRIVVRASIESSYVPVTSIDQFLHRGRAKYRRFG